MRTQAISGNIGHFDNEIAMAGLETFPGVERKNVKPQVDVWTFPGTAGGHSVIVMSVGRLMNISTDNGTLCVECRYMNPGNPTVHPSFVMLNSFTNQVLAQLELFTKPETYPVGVYVLP